jgi:DNA-binding TFAR19-related protein (PDSD5 family)
MRFSSLFQPTPPASEQRQQQQQQQRPREAAQRAAVLPQELPDELDARVRLVGEWQLGEA